MNITGSAEARPRHQLTWHPAEKPVVKTALADFAGDASAVEVHADDRWICVTGWDLRLVLKAFRQARSAFLEPHRRALEEVLGEHGVLVRVLSVERETVRLAVPAPSLLGAPTYPLEPFLRQAGLAPGTELEGRWFAVRELTIGEDGISVYGFTPWYGDAPGWAQG